MYDAARIEASIELLSECEESWQSASPMPADIVINRYFKSKRYMGSKDRAAIAELVYFTIRNYATLTWWAQRGGESGARALIIAVLLLRGLLRKEKNDNETFDAATLAKKTWPIELPQLHKYFDGQRFCPDTLSNGENAYAKTLIGQPLLHPDMPAAVRLNFPVWMEDDIKASLGDAWETEVTALSQEAPVDLRTNTLLTTRDILLKALREEGYKVEQTRLSPIGIRMQSRAPIFTSACFKQGWFEMQDEGSQLVSLLLPAKEGDKIIDFCAGAGGKTLALAAKMHNKGRILAWDTSGQRLEQMRPRLKRAKVDNVQLHVLESEHDAFIKRHKESANGVFIDAPCSGSGTWRRNPDLKWRMQKKDLNEILAVQQSILQSAARLVKKGGHLLYVTCSILQSENESQIETFLSGNKNFRVVLPEKLWSNFSDQTMKQGGTIRLTPHKDGTDGFFAALLQRCE
jgi:16S rRNA (cytosine967-C5)-methyltransferase